MSTIPQPNGPITVQTLSDDPRKVFMEGLATFLKTKNKNLNKIPTLGHRELDLWGLWNEVKLRGGVQEVIRNKQWHTIVKSLDLPATCTNAAFALRVHYTKYLKEYEFHLNGDDQSDNVDDYGESVSPDEPKQTVLLKRKEMSDRPCQSSKKFKLNYVDLELFDNNTLLRYRKYFNLNSVTNYSDREDLLREIYNHFTSQKIQEDQCIQNFREALANDDY